MLNKIAKSIGTLCALSLCLSFHPLAHADKMGMTWKKQSHHDTLGVDRVGCSGCEAYKGDTSCSTKLPILCLKQDASPDPGVPHTGGDHSKREEFYNGWAEGHIGLTFPVPGDALTGIAYADKICEVQFGSGYRMGEFHDGTVRSSGGKGGWNWYAYGNVDDSSRFWVYIIGQPSNCWGLGIGDETVPDTGEVLALLLGSEPSGGECTQAELKAEYDKGYAASGGATHCTNPSYRYDPRKKLGILDLPAIDLQLLEPFTGTWSTKFDAFSAVMEEVPGTMYFQITKTQAKPDKVEAKQEAVVK
ncbi:MAG: hypothetical protein VSS75_015230 [Candidatus Parabeggiatoa sp.]|nr:hypothetical protein [Candidatus Parabeggiatoa sp.]